MQLRNELLPYQETGVAKLSKLKVGVLAMEQGTGKTITALALIIRRLEKNKVDKVLWLCPCSAKKNIKDEILKQAPVDLLPDIMICGIETLSASVRVNAYLLQYVKEHRCFLVVDESLLVKNHRAYRSKNIKRLASYCKYKLLLNGTIISRNESDLFSQYEILDWRILGYQSYWSFAANHLEFDPQNPQRVIRCHNTDYLACKIGPYTYEVKKEDCLQLPKKKYETRYFSLTREQEEHYNQIADILLFDLDETKPETIYRLFSGLSALVCGKRIIFYEENGYEHLKSVPFFEKPEEDPRLQLLLEIVSREKTIIFCTYTEDITRVTRVLNQKYGPETAVRFDGMISQKKRNEAIIQFREKSTYLVANRNCAGFSLNLQFAHHIIYYSNTWDLATRIQSEDRVHRLGQKYDILITDICAWNTIDLRILRSLERKEGLLESFKDVLSHAPDISELRDWLYLPGKAKRRKSMLYDCSDLEDKENYAETIS